MNFPHSLVRMRPQHAARVGVQVPDDADGLTDTVAPLEAPFRGWVQPSPIRKRVSEGAVDDSEAAFSSHLLFAPFGVDLRKGDRVRFEPDTGLHYEAVDDPQDAAGRHHHLEVDLVEYRYEGAA